MLISSGRGRAFVILVALLLLPSCGGGGGGDGSTAGMSVSVLVVTPPASLPRVIDICETPQGKVTADVNGITPASASIQQCLDSGTFPSGTWVMPGGLYLLDLALDIRRAIFIEGAGVTWKASKTISGNGGSHTMIFAGYMSGVQIHGLTLDGNIVERQGAAFCDGTNNAYAGGNINFDHVDDVVIDTVTTKNAVCGSGMVFSGKRARIVNSTFANNGIHHLRHWADGMTLLNCDDCAVTDNRFIDNSDIGLVVGGGERTRVERNMITQTTAIFAGLALDNFNGTQSGSFIGTVFTGNSIDCGNLLCNFGINIGPLAWYKSPNIRGGTVTGNIVKGAKIGILAGGAGTKESPTTIFANTVEGSPEFGALASFSCGLMPVGPRIYGAESVIDTRGEVLDASGKPLYIIASHRSCPMA